jgi:hypothetical protein
MDLEQTAVNTLSYRVLRTFRSDHRSGVSGHLVQAGRQLHRAARPLRPASAVAGQ